jgi:ferredoxin-NADP reductase
MAAMSFKSTLLEKIPRSGDTTSYRFSRPGEYSFKAGQWFTITIDSAEGPLDHHFSHADSPTESQIELTTRLTGSTFKKTLDTLPVGAQVDIQGAYGAFLFGYDKPKIAFLTGGIGVTPVRSMLRYLADTKGAGRVAAQELAVFYGSMTEDGIVYKDDFDQFEQAV